MAPNGRHKVRRFERHPLRHHASGRMAGKVDTRRVDAGFSSEDVCSDHTKKGDVVDIELCRSRLAAAATSVPALLYSLRSHEDEVVLIGHECPPAIAVQVAGACAQAVQLNDERIIGGGRNARWLVLDVGANPDRLVW